VKPFVVSPRAYWLAIQLGVLEETDADRAARWFPPPPATFCGMSEHPHSKTFPGRVRIVSPGPLLPSGDPQFPAKVHRIHDDKGRFKATRVTVPAGADMQYAVRDRPGGVSEFDVSVIAFEPAKAEPTPAPKGSTPPPPPPPARPSLEGVDQDAPAEVVYREDDESVAEGPSSKA